MEVEPDTPLLWVIREQVGLTGTKYGCGVAQCGACSVHINGEVQRSCSIPVSAVKATDRIVTIEGLSREQLASRCRRRGRRSTSRSAATASRGRSWPRWRCCARSRIRPTSDIDEAMTNICRCGTYQRIRAAVHMAAGMQGRRRAGANAPKAATPRRPLMKTTDDDEDGESVAPQVHRRLGHGRGRRARARPSAAFRDRRRRRPRRGSERSPPTVPRSTRGSSSSPTTAA